MSRRSSRASGRRSIPSTIEAFDAPTALPLQVANPWFSGDAAIPTYSREVMLATRLRVLGRVFDLQRADRSRQESRAGIPSVTAISYPLEAAVERNEVHRGVRDYSELY